MPNNLFSCANFLHSARCFVLIQVNKCIHLKWSTTVCSESSLLGPREFLLQHESQKPALCTDLSKWLGAEIREPAGYGHSWTSEEMASTKCTEDADKLLHVVCFQIDIQAWIILKLLEKKKKRRNNPLQVQSYSLTAHEEGSTLLPAWNWGEALTKKSPPSGKI